MLSAKEIYRRAFNLRRNVKDGRTPLSSAVDRLFDIMAKSKNPRMKFYVHDWDDFVPIKERGYFIREIKKGLPTLRKREYGFYTDEMDEDDATAERDADSSVKKARQHLAELRRMNVRLVQHSAPSGRYEPASYRGLNIILYDLKNEVVRENKYGSGK